MLKVTETYSQPQKHSRISGKETPIPRFKSTHLTTSGVSFPVPVNTAYSFAVGLEATQGHSSTTATKALLQKNSSVLAVHLVGLQAGSGVRRDLQTAILTQN